MLKTTGVNQRHVRLQRKMLKDEKTLSDKLESDCSIFTENNNNPTGTQIQTMGCKCNRSTSRLSERGLENYEESIKKQHQFQLHMCKNSCLPEKSLGPDYKTLAFAIAIKK